MYEHERGRTRSAKHRSHECNNINKMAVKLIENESNLTCSILKER